MGAGLGCLRCVDPMLRPSLEQLAEQTGREEEEEEGGYQKDLVSVHMRSRLNMRARGLHVAIKPASNPLDP